MDVLIRNDFQDLFPTTMCFGERTKSWEVWAPKRTISTSHVLVCIIYSPWVMDMHTSHLIEAANFGILLSLWDTLRNILRNTESKEKYVYSISVSKIICCGGWPLEWLLEKKQFKYNLTLIFHFSYHYISFILQQF